MYRKAFLFFQLIFLLSANSLAAETRYHDQLISQYENSIKKNKIADNLAIQSSYIDDRLTADVYSLIEYPVKKITKLFTDKSNICEFMLLNLNIKTCLNQNRDHQSRLIIYAGRKFYQHPGDAEKLAYLIIDKTVHGKYVDLLLTSKDGPYNTSDYLIHIRAIAYKAKTILHIRSAYTTSVMSRLGSSVYLATLGRGKIGFSIKGYSDTHEPVYVDGEDGVIERNAMRYYLAILAMLTPVEKSEKSQFIKRAEYWFDQTQKYKKQLYELSKNEYIAAKQQEYENQIALQKIIDQGGELDAIFNTDDD